MIETRVLGGFNQTGKTRHGFGFDLKPAGFGVPKTRVLGGFEYPSTLVPASFACPPLSMSHNGLSETSQIGTNRSHQGPGPHRDTIHFSELNTH